jgi:hypothetical protein
MNALEDRIAQHLRATAPPTGGAGPARIARLARRRAQRRTAIGGVAAVGVLAGAAFGVARLATPGRVDVTGPAESTPAIVDSPLEWEIIDSDSTLQWPSQQALVTDDGLFALSTAPGAAEDPSAAVQANTLYRSTDGVTWEPGYVIDEGGFTVQSITGTADGLVAVGTGPSSAQIGTSTDGGETFEITDLPLDLDPYSVFGRTPTVTASVAHRDGITVVAANVFSYVTPEDVGLVWSDDVFIEQVADGFRTCDLVLPTAEVLVPVDVTVSPTTVPIDEASCTVTPFPATLTDSQVDALDGSLHVFVDDGFGFAETARPPIESSYGADVLSLDDRFVLASFGPGLALSQSADGASWTAMPAVGEPVWEVDRFGDGLASIGYDQAGASIFSATVDGSSWTATNLSDLVAVPDGGGTWTWAQAIGPVGATAVVAVAADMNVDLPVSTSYVLHTSDGVSWSVIPIADLVGEEPAAISNVVMTADSVNITYREQGAADGDGVPQQRVLVGRYP